MPKEKYLVFDILSFRNCLCGYDMGKVTAGFIFWARACRKFGNVHEFGMSRNLGEKAEKEIACRVEAPSAQSF
jgi:hypothetical protein